MRNLQQTGPNIADFMPQGNPLEMLSGLAQMFAMFQGLQNQDQRLMLEQQQFDATNEFTGRELDQRDRGLAMQTRELEMRGDEMRSNNAYRTAATEDARKGRIIEQDRNNIQRDALKAEAGNREMMNLTNMLQLVTGLQAAMPNDGRVQALGRGLIEAVSSRFGVALPDASTPSDDQRKLQQLGGSVGTYAPMNPPLGY